MDLWALQESQAGVISRRQVLAAGRADHDLRRLLRRRDLAVVHEGVYVDHTGPLTWLQQAWGAVLLWERAALSHDSALRVLDGPGRRDRLNSDPIHVAVDRSRTVTSRTGIVVHQARRTTPGRLLDALAQRSRIARRDLMTDVLRDIAAGSCSALEHRYLNGVERAHGLPTPGRQVHDSLKGPVYRDVEYKRFGLVIELDGRHFHDDATSRDLDMERDLDTAVRHRNTVRLGWGQVHVRPCATAFKVGTLLQRRGWDGMPVPCPLCLSKVA